MPRCSSSSARRSPLFYYVYLLKTKFCKDKRDMIINKALQNIKFNGSKKMSFKKPYVLKIFKSHYCKFVFFIALIGVYSFTPKKIFYGPYYTLLGILFIIITSLTLTCFVRSIKDRVLSAKANGASLLGILSIVFGFGALQACTIGTPVCGATIGGGVIALIFPGFAFNLIEKYSLWIILISIIIQVLALYFMKCLKFNCKEVKY